MAFLVCNIKSAAATETDTFPLATKENLQLWQEKSFLENELCELRFAISGLKEPDRALSISSLDTKIEALTKQLESTNTKLEALGIILFGNSSGTKNFYRISPDFIRINYTDARRARETLMYFAREDVISNLEKNVKNHEEELERRCKIADSSDTESTEKDSLYPIRGASYDSDDESTGWIEVKQKSCCQNWCTLI